MASSSVIETGPASTCGRGSWSPSTRWVVAADRQGSERLVLSSTGSAIGSREYDAYGNLRTQTGTSVAFDDTGNRRDAESGLLYLRSRLYDPATGRFLSPDPAGDCPSTPLSAHAYLYGLANPARYTDVRGLEADEGPRPDPDPTDAPPAMGPIRLPIQWLLDAGVCSVGEPDLCLSSTIEAWVLGMQIPSLTLASRGNNLAKCIERCLRASWIVRYLLPGAVIGTAALCGGICTASTIGFFACFPGCVGGSIPYIGTGLAISLPIMTLRCAQSCR